MQIYLFKILNIYTFFMFRNKSILVVFFKNDSDPESGEAVVVESCTGD